MICASLILVLLRMTEHVGEEEVNTKPWFMPYLTTKRRLKGTARKKLKSSFRWCEFGSIGAMVDRDINDVEPLVGTTAYVR